MSGHVRSSRDPASFEGRGSGKVSSGGKVTIIHNSYVEQRSAAEIRSCEVTGQIMTLPPPLPELAALKVKPGQVR